jgi:hypothetical protein
LRGEDQLWITVRNELGHGGSIDGRAILLKLEEHSFANVVFNTFWSIPIWFAASIAYVLGLDTPEYRISRNK